MNAALRHRGPDDDGVTSLESRSGVSQTDNINSPIDCTGYLGNTRLAIIDLSSAAHQPMHDDHADLTITYNGETYNFQGLREEIGNEFGPWRSHSDTEVVLRAYRKWGVAAFSKFRGMFALAIWDARKKELILARDPFGIKPLYYHDSVALPNYGRGFIFSSEVRALLASGMVQRRLSAEALESYLAYGSVSAPLTIIEGVKCLLPGHFLRVSVASGSFTTENVTYEPPRSTGEIPCPSHSRDQAVETLRARLEESVSLHLVSDVPVGIFLSGGLDSSALVALMKRVSKEVPKTFSVVFDEAAFSEAEYSRRIAEKLQTEHSEVRLTEQQLFELLPAAIGAMDQPTIDGVNTFVVSKAVKEAGITVALSGLGGDEIFAGYPSFRRALQFQRIPGFPRLLLSYASTLVALGVGQSVKLEKFRQLFRSAATPADVYEISRQLFAPRLAKRLLARSVHAALREEIRRPKATAGNGARTQLGFEKNLTFHGPDALDTVNAISQLELKGYMANTLLRDTDSMSMAHSLEVRVPFVDSDIVGFVLSLPGHWKVNSGATKPLLCDVVKDLLPQNHLNRSKMGFTLPLESWMQSRLREELGEVLGQTETLTSLGLNAGAVDQIWRAFLRGPQRVGWSRPWSIYILAKWCQAHGVTAGD